MAFLGGGSKHPISELFESSLGVFQKLHMHVPS